MKEVPYFLLGVTGEEDGFMKEQAPRRGYREQQPLTVDGRPPTTIEELKIASLTPGVRTYINMGILIGRETTPEPTKNRFKNAQMNLLAFMGDGELEELGRFRSWQGLDEFTKRGGGENGVA